MTQESVLFLFYAEIVHPWFIIIIPDKDWQKELYSEQKWKEWAKLFKKKAISFISQENVISFIHAVSATIKFGRT